MVEHGVHTAGSSGDERDLLSNIRVCMDGLHHEVSKDEIRMFDLVIHV